MDTFLEPNEVQLCGTLAQAPAYSHTSRGQEFFRLSLRILRLSGNADTVPLLIRREQLEALPLSDAEKLQVSGELRSFNNRRGEGPRLVITVFARELRFSQEEDQNLVRLQGTLCRPPSFRTTPMGREICDLMLAVNRRYSRSDYLPCICWGATARRAARWTVGQQLQLEGRIQSREYRKLVDGELLLRTAYEVSATEIEATPEGDAATD